MLLLTSGMRVSELCGLRLRHMFSYDGQAFVKVRRKGGKLEDLQLVDDAVEAISGYLAERWTTTGEVVPALASQSTPRDDLPLFATPDGKAMKREGVAYVITACSRLAWPEQESRPRFSPHGMRHTALTTLIINDVPIRKVQKIAGHSDPSTTQRYLHDVENLSVRSEVHKLNGRFTAKSKAV